MVSILGKAERPIILVDVNETSVCKHYIKKIAMTIFKASSRINEFYQYYTKLKTIHQSIRRISTSLKWAAPISMAYSSFQSTRPEHINNLQPIVIMHGLMGSKTNWKSMGKAINAKTGRDVYTVDARNHGDSPHTPEHNYPLLAEDLLYFLQEHNISRAILMGHSMGGRAVMAAALMEPTVVEKLMVLDISPLGVSKSISALPRFMEIMLRLNVPADLNIQEARKYVDDLLKPAIVEKEIRDFILTNLIYTGEEYKWRLNIESLSRNFNPHMSAFPLCYNNKFFEGETAFVGGALSDYLRHTNEDEIQEIFPQATFHFIEGAGHWLHADKPREFLDLVLPLLDT